MNIPSLGDFVYDQDKIEEKSGITALDLRQNLLARAVAPGDPRSHKVAWSVTETEEFLVHSDWARRNSHTTELEIFPETLLVFGSEIALNAHFPQLKTCFVRRDIERGHAKETALPLNLIDLHASLMMHVAECFAPIHGELSKETGGHASLRNEVFSRWFLEMAIFRDYSQERPARFVQDRQYLFLEYPRVVPNLSNSRLESLLKSVGFTMQVEDSESTSQSEKAYFSMTPVRVKGRFFKIMAAIPPESPLLIQSDHASLINALDDHASRTTPLVTIKKPGRPPSPPKADLQKSPDPKPSAPPVTVKPEVAALPADSSDRTTRILAFCSSPRGREEIQRLVGMNNRDHFRKEVLNRLIDQGLIAPTIPDKPNSPKQRYLTVSPIP